MKKPELLIATTNAGKQQEILTAFSDLPFYCQTIFDINSKIPVPREDETTLEGNALKKARHYGEFTGRLTLADDSGLFIDALQGWPGHMSARIAEGSQAQNELLLERMKQVDTDNRGATFVTVLALYDPTNNSSFICRGETRGTILEAPVAEISGFGQDPIFYLPEAKKTYAEMTIAEKNGFSHRGKALKLMEYILVKQYGGRHIVVPLALIIKNGKLLMSLRNDPHRPEFHKKWELPGGSMEMGETIETNLLRETREETGYEVMVVSRLTHIQIEFQEGKNYAYQVYLLPHVCRIIGGAEKLAEGENLEMRWFDLDEVLNFQLIGANAITYKTILPELKLLIATHNL